MDQYYGLNTWARDLLSETVEVEEKGERLYPNGSSEPFSRIVFVPLQRSKVVSALDGTDNDASSYNLHRHEFPDGAVYEEYIQAVSSYSGPCYFIALKKDGEVVNESLWQKDEMRVG